MPQQLPDVNKRVREVIDRFADGNVSGFTKMINEGVPSMYAISQQRLNRLFKIDSKINRYPGVAADIIKAITNRVTISTKH